MVESQCLLEPEKVGEAGGMLLVSCDLALHMGYGNHEQTKITEVMHNSHGGYFLLHDLRIRHS